MSTNHSKDAVRLCEHIVKHAFGNIVHRVAALLLSRGRLAVADLARLGAMPHRTAAAALIILMQHGLVTTSCMYLLVGEGAPDGLYEFDEKHCLSRLRYPHMLALTERMPQLAKVKAEAVEVLRLIMLHGRLPVRTILQLDDRLEAAILPMIKADLLVPTAPALQVTYNDVLERRVKIQRLHREGHGDSKKLLSKPDLQRIEQNAAVEINGERAQLASRSNAIRMQAKKETLVGTATLTINHDRYGVIMRDELLVDAAREKWNEGAGIAMRAVLAATADEATLSDQRTPSTVSLNAAKVPLEQQDTLKSGLQSPPKTTQDRLRQYLAIMAGEDAIVDNGSFLYKQDSGSNPTYLVEIERIAIKLRETVLRDVVRSRLGDKAARVLSVVMQAQVASEQTVRDCGMLPFKEARQHLAALQAMSLIETQDVPKSGVKARTGPAPEFHFWSIDLARAYNTLISSLYKTVGNALERREKETAARRVVWAKRHQTKLAAKDHHDIAETKGLIAKMNLAILRSEMMLFILRDLPGWPAKRG